MTKQEWLEAKYTTIGATDASVILGVNPYKTVYELYAGKAKLVPADETISTKPAVMRGVMLEPIIRNLFDATIKPVVHEEYRQITMPGYDYITCTPDGIVGTYEEPEAMLEIKTGNLWGWQKNLFASYYYTQCQHQLMCTPSAKQLYLYAMLFSSEGTIRFDNLEVYGKSRKASSPHSLRLFNIYPDKELHTEMLRRYCIFKFCLDMGDISRLADIADPICIEDYVNLVP